VVREKRPGEWWVFINHHRKRISKKIGGDEKAALEVAKKIEAKLILEDFNIAKKEEETPSFKKYAEQWLETYVKSVRRLSTYQRYRDLLVRFAFPEIGSTPIDRITRGNIRDLLLKLNGKGLSRSTIALMKDAVSGPLNHAVDEELISVNPTRGLLKALHIGKDKREHLDPLNHEEVNLFLETCLKLYPEHYPFFLCAFRTGARLGELLALQWGTVDWNGKFIEIRQSYKLGRFSSTKTGKARRVDMSNQLLETLRSHFTHCKEDGLKLGLGNAPEPVFHRNGQPVEQNYIRRIFKRILQKAGLREIRIHDIRHTYSSLLLSDGVSPVYVKEQLGHSSIQMTVDIYGHWIPNSNLAAVNLLDGYPSAKDEPKPAQEMAEAASGFDLPETHPNAPQAHPAEMIKAQLSKIAPLPEAWCRRGDSNPYVGTHTRP
jgi:integrase